MEHLTTGNICGKMDKGRRQEKIINNLLTWDEKVSAQERIYGVGDHKMLRIMNAHASQQCI